MKIILTALFLLASKFVTIYAECPNACSAHGRCGAYDMCICYRNWMANDCSERICQFGNAHVDSPKGDLDASSGALSGPSVNVIPNDMMFPYGTTEQFPAMVDSSANTLINTAHAYMECSNKGICDRATGLCGCFVGYEGSACQRASCPQSANGVCNGHGTCQSIKSIANADYGNDYELWDKSTTMGCVCDAGYTGADCSERTCKVGADPLYHNDYNTVRYNNFTYQIYTTGTSKTITGNYSIVFYDYNGQDWRTDPIEVSATCLQVINALEGLPNNVVPTGSVRCAENPWRSFRSHGQNTNDTTIPILDTTAMFIKVKFTLVFSSNPGMLRQPDLDFFLDGSRATLYSPQDTATGGSSVGYAVFPNGYAGENTDYVPDLCTGLLVQLLPGDLYHKLATLSATNAKLLKTCLGGSDGSSDNNADVYNWDQGDTQTGQTTNNFYTNPHLIKLVDATQDLPESVVDPVTGVTVPGLNSLVPSFYEDESNRPYPKTKLCTKDTYTTGLTQGFASVCSNKNPPGFYAVLFFDGTDFNLLTRAANDYGSSTFFHVYTTTGYLKLVSGNAFAVTMNTATKNTAALKVNSYYSNEIFLAPTANAQQTSFTTTYGTSYQGNLDCDTNPTGSFGSLDCLSKGDMIMLLNTDTTQFATNLVDQNPIYPDIYTIKNIEIAPYTDLIVGTAHTSDEEITRRKVTLDYGVNNMYAFGNNAGIGGAAIYKFYPPSNGGYNYVAACSNRGLCDKVLGVCSCFAGYTNDNCNTQNALAK